MNTSGYQHMTADKEALGVQYGLGDYRVAYKPMHPMKCLPVLVMVTFTLLGGFLSYTAASHGFSYQAVLLLIGLLLAFLSVGIFTVYHYSGLSVFIYDYGLVYVRHKFQKPIHWMDVQEVRHEVIVTRDSEGESISHTYIVSCTNGPSLTLDGTFAKLQELGKTIEVETASYLFPPVWNTYQVSDTAVFGALTVTSQGLRYDGRNLLPLRYNAPNPLPWSEVKSIEFIDDRVIIRDQGKRFPQPLPWVSVKMPSNVEVFRMLVEHIQPGVLE